MKYKIPVTWKVAADLYIEARSLEEAFGKAEDASLPSDGEYVEGSYEVEYDAARAQPENMTYAHKVTAISEQAKDLFDSVETWADFSNAVFGQAGMCSVLTKEERQQFVNTAIYASLHDMNRRLMRKFGIVEGATPVKYK